MTLTPTNIVDLIEQPEDPDGGGGDGGGGPLVDSDGDGLSDEEELNLGTYPEFPDSDGDGFLDGEEVDAGSNPMDSGSTPQDGGDGGDGGEEEQEEVIPANVIYSLADDTAPIRVKNELNPYLKATYGLVWEEGDPLVKEFPVTIINDQKLEDNETVLLKLDEPFLLRRWAMTTNAFDAMMLDLISNSDEEVDPYWVQNQAIASGGGDGGEEEESDEDENEEDE